MSGFPGVFDPTSPDNPFADMAAVAVRLPVGGWVRGSEEHHDQAASPAGAT